MELVSEVDQVVWVDATALQVVAVTVDVVSTQVLIIKKNDDLVIGVAHNCSSQAEGDVLTSGRVYVDNSVTHTIVAYMLLRERLAPEGEVLLVQEGRLKVLESAALQLDRLELLLDMSLGQVKFSYEVLVERIEAHLNIGKMRERAFFDPLCHFADAVDHLELVDLLSEEVLQIEDLLINPHSLGDGFKDITELFQILFDDIKAFLRVLPVLANVPGTSRVLVVLVVIILIVSKVIKISHESHIVRDVHLLHEVFDVQTQIDNLFLELLTIIECDKA